MTQTQPRPLAVVTGASSGIGFELARQFADHGFDLVVAAENDIAPAAETLREQSGSVDAVQVDLATFDGVEHLCDRVRQTGRPVAALALNAGIGEGGEFATQSDLHKELRIVDLNVRSTVHLAKLILPEMVRRRAGRVLITSSIVATAPGPYEAVYAASKAFVQSFAEAIRNELKDTGVTVTSLLPGATDTPFFEKASSRARSRTRSKWPRPRSRLIR